MSAPDNALIENRRLRRTIRDLVSLSALPAVWIGLGPEGIARSLADSLLHMLSLDLVYIRLENQAGGEAIETVGRNHRGDPAHFEAVKRTIVPLLADFTEPVTIAAPVGDGTLRLTVTRFGVGTDSGVLVTGSREANFPSEQDRLLLAVGANQSAIVIQRRRVEERLHRQEEWLRVTLASIGDAVIATDTQGRVTFLNGVARELTGWTNDEAQGKPLHTVFKIINEDSRQPVENPVDRVLREGAIIGLANHTVLIARDGTERPIDDSAAPIRDGSHRLIGVVLIFRDVTEQRRTERALRQREQQLRLVTDHAPVFLAHCDRESRYMFVNKGYATRFGLTPEDVVGKPIAEVVGESAYANFRQYVEAALAGETVSFDVEIPYERTGARFMHCAYAPEFDSSGRVEGLVAAITDVTEGKRAEEALRRSEAHLRAVVETTPACIKLVARDGTLLDMNSSGLAMLDADRPEQIAGKCVYDFITEEYRDAFRVFNEGICRGESGTMHFEIVGLRGAKRHMETYAAPLRAANGDFLQLAVTLDVTERKRVELELQDARSRLDAALRAGAITTWIWDIPSNRLFADKGLALLFNLSPSEAEGGLLDKYLQSIHPDDAQRVAAALSRSLETFEDYEADYRIPQADGAVRWVVARGRPERDGSGRPTKMAGVLVDITERKRLEDELRIRVEQLAEADRRKDEFLATLAHELRNPLAPIRNSLQILKMQRIDAPTGQQIRDMMERQVHHLVRLVDDLLDVSRVMRGKIELRRGPVELAAIVARAIEIAQPLIEVQGHRLEIDVASESLLLHADPVRLAQVVGNLLTNAAKYTDANGHISLSARRENEEVVLTVRDTGIGLAPDMLPHVFELFMQVDHASTKAQGGLGIGLTLVKSLVEMHGGTVQARSAGLGKGSEFVVRLPLLVVGTEKTAEQGRTVAPVIAGAGHRVLVVDDNEDAAVSLAMLLRLQGHDVRVAHDGPSALELAKSHRPVMVFLDIGMPGMDGYEVARQLRQIPDLGKTVLTALTGWGQQEDRRRSAQAGFHHHLVKPPEAEAVESLLAKLNKGDADHPHS